MTSAGLLLALLLVAPDGGMGADSGAAPDAGPDAAPAPGPAAAGIPAWAGGFDLLRQLGGGSGEPRRTEQEQALAASLALWPGLRQARVHLTCPAAGSWDLAPPGSCRGVAVLQPRPGAAPDALPRPEEVRRLLAAGSPIADPARVQVIWAPSAAAGGPGEGGTTTAARGAAPALEDVGPFRVAAGEGSGLRRTLVLLCGAVLGLAVLAIRARRALRARPAVPRRPGGEDRSPELT